MKDVITSNVLSGVRLSVIELQDKISKRDNTIRKENESKEKKAEVVKKDKKAKTTVVPKLSICIAEFVGTAMLLFFGCMGCITGFEPEQAASRHMSAITFGLSVMVIIQIFGHISGAHLNPAVTMVTVILGYMDLYTVPVYLIGQFAGAVFGFGLLKLLLPLNLYMPDREVFDEKLNITSKMPGFCVTVPHPTIGPVQALVMEMIITAVLILVCCGIWDKRNKQNQDSAPLRFGFVIAAIAMAAGPFSGASMNTVRSFGPAVLNGYWTHQWIYFVGPTVGALIGAYFYKCLYSLPPDEDEEDEMEQIPLETNNVAGKA